MIQIHRVSRAGLSLLEVLTAIFIMGIGMLALMTLFPAGALSMARAVREDRASVIAANAAALAAATDLCHDANVNAAFGNTNTLILVDPHYVTIGGGGTQQTVNGVIRVRPAWLPAAAIPDQQMAQFFVFQDEIKFDNLGAAAPTVDRPGTYSIAFALRRPVAGSNLFTEVSVLVFSQRNTDLNEGENLFAVTGVGGEQSLTLAGAPDVRQRSWIMDTTAGPHAGDFYRIESVTDSRDNSNNPITVLGLDRPLKHNVTSILHFRDVIAVVERGTNWRP